MGNRELIILLAYSESSLNYNAKHSKKGVVGICGIDTRYWANELKDNGIKINSLESCEYVFNYYLEKNKGNKKKALLDYKGVINDKKVSGVVETILQKEKELKKDK